MEGIGNFWPSCDIKEVQLASRNWLGENSPFEKLMPGFAETLRDHEYANVKMKSSRIEAHSDADEQPESDGGKDPRAKTVFLDAFFSGLVELDCNAGNLEQVMRMMAESQPQMAGGTVENRDARYLFPMLGATTTVLLIAACKLVVHLYAGHRYGYLGDELYYLACSHHLAWS